MNKKLKVTPKVLDHVACKNPDTKDYIEENLKEFCEVEGLKVGKVIYVVVCFCLISSCLKYLSE